MHIELDEETREFIKDLLSKMEKTVSIELFVSKACDYGDTNWCILTEEFLNILSTLAPEGRVVINKYVYEESSEKFIEYSIDKNEVPIVCLVNCLIKYLGAPLGEEARSLIDTLISLSTGRTTLRQSTKRALNALSSDLRNKKVEITTVVTPSCPYCSHAVLLANMFALESSGKIRSMIIDAAIKPEIASTYFITAVPAIILRREDEKYGSLEFIGPPTETDLLERVLRYSVGD